MISVTGASTFLILHPTFTFPLKEGKEEGDELRPV